LIVETTVEHAGEEYLARFVLPRTGSPVEDVEFVDDGRGTPAVVTDDIYAQLLDAAEQALEDGRQ